MITKRILLKISGEFLAGDHADIFDRSILSDLVRQISEISKLGHQLAIVVGGGNILRGSSLSGVGFSRTNADNMGMLATAINGLALSDILEQHDISASVYSSHAIHGVLPAYNSKMAIKDLKDGKVCFFVFGTGNPFFTTDTAACLRAAEIQADIVFKATKVNGIFDEDPIKKPGAKRYDKITYQEVLDKQLGVMDMSAILLCKEHSLPVRIFDLFEENALLRAIEEENFGSQIY